LIDPLDLAICTQDAGPGAAPPIAQIALFHFPDFESLAAGLEDEFSHRVYGRGRNPTVEIFEDLIAALERAEAAKAFASGMGAMSAILHGLLSGGDHILLVNQTYGPILQLADELARLGIEHDRLLDTGPASVERALRPNTKLIWIESPGTMTFRIVDIASVAAMARSRGVITVVDNSWATPLFQKPIPLDADLVVHSCSKYIGGHGDVLGGVAAGSRRLIEAIFAKAFMLNGATPSPFDAWLLIRSLRTLPIRMAKHESDALEVARYLLGHEAVRAVHHPLLACKDGAPPTPLRGTSGLFSFELKRDGYDDIVRTLNRLKRIKLGVSWGGFGSLAITPQRRDNDEALAKAGLPRGLIRLSIGLEGAEALIDDLCEALA